MHDRDANEPESSTPGGWAHDLMFAILGEEPVLHNYFQLVAGVFAVVAATRSLLHIRRHILDDRTALEPNPMRVVTLRILAVVPIYALDSFACLALNSSPAQWTVLLSFMREAYEAVAMCSFMQFALTYLGGPKKLAKRMNARHYGRNRNVEHINLKFCGMPKVGMQLLRRPYMVGADFVSQVIIGVLQYVVVTVFLFVVNLTIWCYPADPEAVAKLGLQKSKAGQFAGAIPNMVKAASCAYSLYHLILLYLYTGKEVPGKKSMLGAVNPVKKFLAIKGIIFFTFYQGALCGILTHTSLLEQNMQNDPRYWNIEQTVEGIKDFLLCIEMLGFSELHRCAYPADEWTTLMEAKRKKDEKDGGARLTILRTASFDIGEEGDSEQIVRDVGQVKGTFFDLFGQVKALRLEAERDRLSMASNELLNLYQAESGSDRRAHMTAYLTTSTGFNVPLLKHSGSINSIAAEPVLKAASEQDIPLF